MSIENAPRHDAVVTEIPSPPDTLVVVAEFPHVLPNRLFAYWTQPELLRRWWPREVDLDPRAGGAYHLSWPEMGWNLRGQYTEVEPGRRLGFTWRWDHEPDAPPTRVDVDVEPFADRGAKLTLTHGPYGHAEGDREMRAGHLEGWRHFLGRLQDVTRDDVAREPQ